MEQQLDPSMLQPQKLDEAVFTTEVMDMAQQNPQEFKDSLIGGMEEIDPNLIGEFKRELASMQLPMEVIEALQKMVDEILSSPDQYELIRQKYLEQGVPEELLPEIFDPTFFGGLQLAISELRKTAAQPANLQEPMTMAQGGLASLGRYGDTMMAHITPSEARLLKRMGGAGTINPQTGLPEFFNPFKAVKSVLKGVGKAVNKIAKSDIGRIALTVGATYLMGPVGSSLFGANTALATAFNTMAGTTLVGVASGQNLKDSLKEGIFAGMSAGFGQAIGSRLSPKFGTAVVRRGIGTGLAATGVGLLRGQDLNKALKGGLGALGQSYGLQVLGNVASGRGAFEGFTRPAGPQVFKVGEGPEKVVGEYDIESRSEFDNVMPGENQYDYMQGKSERLQGERVFENDGAGFAPEANYEPLRTKVGETYDKYTKMLSDKINKDSSFKDVDYANRSVGSQFKSQPRGPYDLKPTSLAEAPGTVTVSDGGKTTYFGDSKNRFLETAEKVVGAPFAAAKEYVYDPIRDLTGKLNPFKETGFLPSTRRENLFNKNVADYQAFQGKNPKMNLSFDEYLKASGKKPNMFDIYGPVGTAGLGAYYASGGFSPEQEEQVFDPYYSGLDYIRDNPDRFIGSYATYIPSYAKGGNVNNFPRKNGAIRGPGTGTSDDIPAMLSDGEFVFTAKAVRGLGKGSRRKGAAKMYKLMRELEKRA